MKQFKLRIPDDFHALIEEAAENADRSLTAEILDRLRRSFDREAILDDLRRVLNEQTANPLPTNAGAHSHSIGAIEARDQGEGRQPYDWVARIPSA